MDKVINFGIPNVGEQIFKNMTTQELIKYLLVSKTWKELAENVLFKRWRGHIFQACENGETEVVKILLERSDNENINWNATDGNGLTPLMLACNDGHKDIVRLLMDHSISKNIDLNAGTNVGDTPFMFACAQGNKDVVKIILEYSDKRNINLNARTKYGYWIHCIFVCLQ